MLQMEKHIHIMSCWGAYKSYEKILEDVPRGSVVAVRGEFDVNTIGLMMALMDHRCIYVPISRAVIDVAYYLETAKVEYYLDMDDEKLAGLDEKADHPLYEKLRQMGHPGIVFFSSGTTGTPKAAVHDLMPYIHRFEEPGKTLRSMAFLLFDHAGGFNTVMHSISNAGLMVTLSKKEHRMKSARRLKSINWNYCLHPQLFCICFFWGVIMINMILAV